MQKLSSTQSTELCMEKGETVMVNAAWTRQSKAAGCVEREENLEAQASWCAMSEWGRWRGGAL